MTEEPDVENLENNIRYLFNQAFSEEYGY